MSTAKKIIKQEVFHTLLRPSRLLPEIEPQAYFGENYGDSLPLVKPEPLMDFEVFSNHTVHVIRRTEQSSVEPMLKEHPEIKKLIEGNDYRYFGSIKLENKRDKQKVQYVHYIYVYNRNYTVEIHADADLKKISKVLKTREQPAPTEDEVNDAIDIARKNKTVAEFITAEMVGHGILLSSTDPHDKHYFGKRIFDIQFGNSEKRLPSYKALVDISSREVISSREIKQSPDKKKEVCHE